MFSIATNKSCSHKFMALLTTYAFNFSICHASPIHQGCGIVVCLLEIKFHFIESECLSTEETNLDVNILAKLMLPLLQCLLKLQFQCHLLTLASDNLQRLVKMLVFCFFLIFFLTEAILSLISFRAEFFFSFLNNRH